MRTFLLITLVLLAACSDRITVRVDYDKSSPVNTRRTFKWLLDKEIESRNQPLVFNELNDKRIKVAVTKEMERAGYVLNEQEGDLLLHYHLVVEEKSTINPSTYGYSYSPYWIGQRTDTYYYREGSIIIDVMDNANKQLLWRGWAFSVLGEEPYLSEELLTESIVRMFKKFPAQPNSSLKK